VRKFVQLGEYLVLKDSAPSRDRFKLTICAGQNKSTEINPGKVKFTLEQAMKAQRGSRGISLLFL
jgi:hypothetical protein